MKLTEKLDAAEKNWKQGDTRSSEFLLIQVVRHLATEHDAAHEAKGESE